MAQTAPQATRPGITAPLVSVVMPSFNQAEFIGTAIDSVLHQSWPSIELIVQDGGSTDATPAILAQRAKADARLRWASQPDDGPADALNRALASTRGTLIGWLNSDDTYAAGAIHRAVNAFHQHPDWMLCYGEGEHINAQGERLGRYPSWPTPKAPGPVPGPEAFQEGCFICQPTAFFKAVMPRLLGPLDTRLGASFDFDYWLRAFNAFPGRIGYLPRVQAHSRLHPACITHNQRRRVALEGMQLLARHQGSAPGHWLLSYRREQHLAGADPHALNEEMAQLLAQVRDWMTPEGWHALAEALKHPPDATAPSLASPAS